MNYGPIYPWIRISFQIKNYILIFLIQDLTVQPYLAMKSEIQPAPAGIKFILLWEVKSTVKNHGKKKKMSWPLILPPSLRVEPESLWWTTKNEL